LIHDLKRQGLTITAIARQVGLDRKTVRRYLQRGLEPPAPKAREPAPRLIEGFQDYLRERVTAFLDLSGKRLLREIRPLGYGAIPRACRPYRAKTEGKLRTAGLLPRPAL
jgi:transposase